MHSLNVEEKKQVKTLVQPLTLHECGLVLRAILHHRLITKEKTTNRRTEKKRMFWTQSSHWLKFRAIYPKDFSLRARESRGFQQCNVTRSARNSPLGSFCTLSPGHGLTKIIHFHYIPASDKCAKACFSSQPVWKQFDNVDSTVRTSLPNPS